MLAEGWRGLAGGRGGVWGTESMVGAGEGAMNIHDTVMRFVSEGAVRQRKCWDVVESGSRAASNVFRAFI